MESESARVTTAAETSFRIDAPNARARTVKVIALDPPSERMAAELAQLSWNGASFLTASAFAGAPQRAEAFSMQGWLSDLAGRTKDLIDEIASADLIVMVAAAGHDAGAAAIIGEACQARGVMTTGLVLGSEADESSARTSAQLRPHVLMLVIAGTPVYIEDMLRALRA